MIDYFNVKNSIKIRQTDDDYQFDSCLLKNIPSS